MTTIPDEIMEQAKFVAAQLYAHGSSSYDFAANIIARALMARDERAARIVDEMGGGLMDRTPAEAAKAIRSGS
jgi:hypothetical protein